MLSLLFDLFSAHQVSDVSHGGAEYNLSVFSRLLSRIDDTVSVSAVWDETKPFDDKLHQLALEKGVRFIHAETKSQLQDIISAGDFNRFYSALPYDLYDLDLGATEFIMTIHGLRPIEMPTDRHEIRYRRGLVQKAKPVLKALFRGKYVAMHLRRFERLLNVKTPQLTIIVPSNHTKYSLIQHFPNLMPDQIRVLYSSPSLAASEVAGADAKALAAYGLKEQEYFLLISGNRWIKNSYRAVKAIDELYSRYPLEPKTVVLGIADPAMFRVDNKERFVFLPYVDTGELISFFRHALCFIYPTLNEGFGYPPFESMRHGTPVICSAVASLPELFQGAALLFNPYSIRELQNRVLHLVHDRDLWQALSSKGKARYNHISSQQEIMANELVSLLMR